MRFSLVRAIRMRCDDGAMDAKNEPTQPTKKPIPDAIEVEAQRVLEENRKHGTSGLSWDEVAEKDKKGWNEITDMGEGD